MGHFRDEPSIGLKLLQVKRMAQHQLSKNNLQREKLQINAYRQTER